MSKPQPRPNRLGRYLAATIKTTRLMGQVGNDWPDVMFGRGALYTPMFRFFYGELHRDLYRLLDPDKWRPL